MSDRDSTRRDRPVRTDAELRTLLATFRWDAPLADDAVRVSGLRDVGERANRVTPTGTLERRANPK